MVPQYLVRWEGFEAQYDEWRTVTELQPNAAALIEEYEASLRGLRQAEAAAPATPAVEAEPLGAPIRRPGRPRKEDTPKRGRGRPRKDRSGR